MCRPGELLLNNVGLRPLDSKLLAKKNLTNHKSEISSNTAIGKMQCFLLR